MATTSQPCLNRAQRKQTLARAFQLNESGKAAVRDHHILLIDDVLITGAKLNEAAQTLTRAGCKSGSALVIARVRQASDQIIKMPIRSCDLVQFHLNDRP